jgi:hypothetical protein
VFDFRVSGNLVLIPPRGTIGKRPFLSFVLLQRILDAKPTVACCDGMIIGYSREGVTNFKGIEDCDIYHNGTWALVDYQSGCVPSGGLNNARFFHIFSAKPGPENSKWDFWQKERKATVRFMKSWSWEEYEFYG